MQFNSDVLGEVAFGKTFFVRDCYKDLVTFMEISKDRGSDFRFVISGTPGIGKSMFIAYCLLRFSSKFSSIILHTKSIIYFIDRGQVSIIAVDEASAMLLNEEILYLVDGTRPILSANCFTILVTSPRFSVYKEFVKARNTTTVLTMPPWSIEELQLTNAQFKLRSDVDLLSLFEKFGGVPRYVLSRKSALEESSFLTAVIDMFNGNFDDITRAFSNELVDKDVFKVSSLLLHLIPNSEFKFPKMRWASRHVLNLVIERHRLSLRSKVKEFIQTGSGFRQFAAATGLLFEPLLHEELLTVTGELVNLKDRSVRLPFHLDQYQLITFPNLASLDEIRSLLYYVPSVGNMGAGDSFAIFNDHLCIFQITVSKRHPVNGKELRRLISSILPKSPEKLASMSVQLIFVVPDFIAADFKVQAFTKKDVSANDYTEIDHSAIETASYKKLPPELKNVEQYVLEIKFRVA